MGIPKTGIPKVGRTHTATLPETEVPKPGIPKSGIPKIGIPKAGIPKLGGQTCNNSRATWICPVLFITFFFSFVLLELKPFLFKGKVPGGK